MTALDSRTGRGTVYRTAARPLTRSLAVTGTLSVLQGVFVTLVLVEAVTLAAWALEPRAGSDATDTVRLAAAVWSTALHTRVHSGAAVVGLPLPGLSLLLGWLISRSVGRLVRSRLDSGEVALTGAQEATRVGLATALPLGLVGGVVAGFAHGPTLSPSVRTAVVGGLLLGLACALVGVRRAWREVDPTPLLDRLPEGAAVVVRTALGGVLGLAAVAGLLIAVTLVRHHDVATGLQDALAAGTMGGLALLVLQLALAPTALAFGIAWLAGPGFALGAGTSVSPSGTRLGDVPALPLLAALPGGTHGPGLVVVLPVLVVGVVAGLTLVRSAEPDLWRQVSQGAIAGVVAATGLGITCALLGGPAGSHRMLTVGPSGWRVALALVLELAPTMALGAGLRVLAERESAER